MPNFKFVENLDGQNSVPVIRSLPVATTQTLVVGDAVVLSSGQVAKASTTFGRCLGVMAEASASQTAGTLVRVYVTTPTQVWRAVATADASSHVLAARTYDLNSSQQVNVSDTSGGSIQIIKTDSSVTDVLIQFTECELG